MKGIGSEVSVEELHTKLQEAQKQLKLASFQHSQGKLTNTASLPQLRHLIARLRTLIGKKEPKDNGKENF